MFNHIIIEIDNSMILMQDLKLFYMSICGTCMQPVVCGLDRLDKMHFTHLQSS